MNTQELVRTSETAWESACRASSFARVAANSDTKHNNCARRVADRSSMSNGVARLDVLSDSYRGAPHAEFAEIRSSPLDHTADRERETVLLSLARLVRTSSCAGAPALCASEL